MLPSFYRERTIIFRGRGKRTIILVTTKTMCAKDYISNCVAPSTTKTIHIVTTKIIHIAMLLVCYVLRHGCMVLNVRLKNFTICTLHLNGSYEKCLQCAQSVAKLDFFILMGQIINFYIVDIHCINRLYVGEVIQSLSS